MAKKRSPKKAAVKKTPIKKAALKKAVVKKTKTARPDSIQIVNAEAIAREIELANSVDKSGGTPTGTCLINLGGIPPRIISFEWTESQCRNANGQWVASPPPVNIEAMAHDLELANNVDMTDGATTGACLLNFGGIPPRIVCKQMTQQQCSNAHGQWVGGPCDV